MLISKIALSSLIHFSQPLVPRASLELIQVDHYEPIYY
jgi:hypothetical protein